MRFSHFVFVAGATAVASAPTKRAPGLSVSVAAPASVTSIDDLTVVASVTNAGTEAVKVLKTNSVLDESATASFFVTKGEEVTPFVGVRVTLAENPEDSAYTVIEAGQTVTATHSLAALYDFESMGTGSFKLSPAASFHISSSKNSSNSLNELETIEVSVDPVEVAVNGDIAKRNLIGHEERAVVSCSTSSSASFISASYTEGRELAVLARNYIQTNGRNSLFTAYWGTSATTTPISVFNSVATESSNSRTLSCSDPYGVCGGGVIAYTVIATTNIYYCSIFYNEVATDRLCSGTSIASRNIRGGTTLHEITHAVAGTNDFGYGVDFDRNLGATNPANALRNADNYNVFATEVYKATQC